MNWLEVGCPHCPSTLIYPRSAAGRTVRCPECDHSYLVPTPGEKPQLAGAWASEPPGRKGKAPSSPLAVGGGPADGNVPAHAGSDEPTVANTAHQGAVESPKPKPTITSAMLKGSAPTSDEPQLAIDSPLAPLPILDPPRATAERQPAPPPKPMERGNVEPPAVTNRPMARSEPSEPSESLAAPPSPRPTAHNSLGESSDEARLRMRRAELRARINLAIFAVGTLVMVVFAWLVIRFSRPH